MPNIKKITPKMINESIPKINPRIYGAFFLPINKKEKKMEEKKKRIIDKKK